MKSIILFTMAFKAKNKSKININTKQTIDAKHQDFIDDFKNKSNLIPDLEQDSHDINKNRLPKKRIR